MTDSHFTLLLPTSNNIKQITSDSLLSEVDFWKMESKTKWRFESFSHKYHV